MLTERDGTEHSYEASDMRAALTVHNLLTGSDANIVKAEQI